MAEKKSIFDSDVIIDFLKRNTSLFIIAVTLGSLVLFGYVELLYYKQSLIQLGWGVCIGAPIVIEGVKFVFLLSTYSSAVKYFGGSTWFNWHLFAIVIGLGTSGYVLSYQYKEVQHMVQLWGNGKNIEDFANFFIVISLLLELRMVVLLSTK